MWKYVAFEEEKIEGGLWRDMLRKWYILGIARVERLGKKEDGE